MLVEFLFRVFRSNEESFFCVLYRCSRVLVKFTERLQGTISLVKKHYTDVACIYRFLLFLCFPCSFLVNHFFKFIKTFLNLVIGETRSFLFSTRIMTISLLVLFFHRDGTIFSAFSKMRWRKSEKINLYHATVLLALGWVCL